MNVTACPDCGCSDFDRGRDGVIYCVDCDHVIDDSNYEPPEPDGEAFRGGEAAAYSAEEQARIQRELK
jgi:uncharacterized Zn finger protein (UPF0148 family)